MDPHSDPKKQEYLKLRDAAQKALNDPKIPKPNPEDVKATLNAWAAAAPTAEEEQRMWATVEPRFAAAGALIAAKL